jgi:lipid II:glycine glycyltransferase (peptidoglycan interpeptide bridge formation enzyme)
MSNKSTYINICAASNTVPIFMQPWWLDAVCDGWDVAITMKGDHVAGIWAYPIENKLGVSILRSPILTPYLGPHIFYPDDIKDSKQDGFEYETIADLVKQLPDFKVWHLAIEPGIKQVGLFKKYKLETAVQQTFLIDLTADEATLLANMKDSRRRNVRQGEKELIVTEDKTRLGDLYKFQQHTLERKGKPLPYSLADLVRIMDACKAHDAASLWVAKDGDIIQAIVWQVWDNNCSYYFMGGQNPEAGGYKAMSLLLWHAMKEAKKRGHKTFDLEGSMDEGVERFFRSFGGTRALYLVLHKNDSLLWKMKNMIFR